MQDILLSAVILGLLWSVVSIGLYVTFRILNIADMTTEGSFPLGAAIAAAMISRGMNPLLALLGAFLGGALAGAVTVFLMERLKIPSLLAGILTMTGLYSINLKVMGQPNVSLLQAPTVMKWVARADELSSYAALWVGLTAVYVLLGLLFMFLQTETGQALIAAGDNPQMATAYGVSVPQMTLLAVMLANGLIGLGGGLIAQYNGFSDVNMGSGAIVVALASIIIGEVLLPDVSFGQRLLSIPLGAIIYRLLQLTVIRLNIIQADDFKLFSALIIALALALPTLRDGLERRKGHD